MYVLVRCKVDFLQPTPEPVLMNAPLPFPYAMARSQLGNIEFMCEVPEGFNATNYFVHPIATSGITPEMYEAMQEFVNRVDRGEVRSTATYNKFKTILAKARGEA